MKFKSKLWILAMLLNIYYKCQTGWEQFILALASVASSNVWMMIKHPHSIFQWTDFFSSSSFWTDPLILQDKYILSLVFSHVKDSISFKMVSDILKHPVTVSNLKPLTLASYPAFHNKMRVTYRLIIGIFFTIVEMNLLHQ